MRKNYCKKTRNSRCSKRRRPNHALNNHTRFFYISVLTSFFYAVLALLLGSPVERNAIKPIKKWSVGCQRREQRKRRLTIVSREDTVEKLHPLLPSPPPPPPPYVHSQAIIRSVVPEHVLVGRGGQSCHGLSWMTVAFSFAISLSLLLTAAFWGWLVGWNPSTSGGDPDGIMKEEHPGIPRRKQTSARVSKKGRPGKGAVS